MRKFPKNKGLFAGSSSRSNGPFGGDGGPWPLLTALIALLLFLPAGGLGATALVDDAGQKHEFKAPPRKVVSLIPSATEIICALGAEGALAGVTYHDEQQPNIVDVPLVGGAFTPRFELINALGPDLLIVAPRDYEKALRGRAGAEYPVFVWDDGVSLAESENRVRLLGRLFQRRAEAEKIVAANNEAFRLIADKLKTVKTRRRVMRLMMADGRLLTPGGDSFQNEIIAASGGLPPDFGPGTFVEVSAENWLKFDPEFVFDCGSDHQALKEFLTAEPWAGATAVREGQMLNFPCALTCRAAANTGYFVSWLAANLYARDFADPARLARPQKIEAERALEIDLPYVARARVVDSRVMDFVHRTLLVDFKEPRRIFSTESGQRDNVMTVGNSYAPAPTWPFYHHLGYERAGSLLNEVLKMDPARADIMVTGADLNNLAVKSAEFESLRVTALVTAGVEGNALRTSKDVGAWYEPGTINVIVLSSHALSPRAGLRAVVTVTEAKTAALWDMDIRSVQSAALHPATGTGTDSVIVVSGLKGPELEYSGGHTKLGELIAQVVYEGVQEAVLKQNGKAHKRHVFARLAERGVNPATLTGGPDCPCLENARGFQAELEALLLTPRYQGFLEAAFSLSDARVMGQIEDLSAFEAWALQIASEIAGRPVGALENIAAGELTPVLNTAINALGTGLKYRDENETARGGALMPCARPSCGAGGEPLPAVQ